MQINAERLILNSKKYMYQTHKTYIKPSMRMLDLINENPSLLLLMEYFEIDHAVNDMTVQELCRKNKIDLDVFLIFSNLYNDFHPNLQEVMGTDLDVQVIIKFLKNSHNYYKNDKYPEIKQYINQLYNHQNSTDVKRIEVFFNDYFNEVLEHLDYEDKVAFPYFKQLSEQKVDIKKCVFSSNEYRVHHTDIETKLSDLKNLLLKHISLNKDYILRRKLLSALFELERNLNIHSIIEEVILLPLIEEIENKLKR